MWFPNWSSDPEYLPSLDELSEIKSDQKTWNFGFSDFIAHNPLWTPFQVLNDEFIKWISEELLKIINKVSSKNIKILEVWAGSWRLSYFLKKELTIENTKKNIEIITTDDLSWFEDENTIFDNHEIYLKNNEWICVENLDAKKSVEKYEPNIVISSWMPKNKDWTLFFKDNKSINAFILIWVPSDCWTEETWKECDLFKLKILDIKWNISWRDGHLPLTYLTSKNYDSSSKVVLFERK